MNDLIVNSAITTAEKWQVTQNMILLAEFMNKDDAMNWAEQQQTKLDSKTTLSIRAQQQQLELHNEVRSKAGINIVECCSCGSILLHKMVALEDDVPILCFGCSEEVYPSDCTDFFYDGMEFH